MPEELCSKRNGDNPDEMRVAVDRPWPSLLAPLEKLVLLPRPSADTRCTDGDYPGGSGYPSDGGCKVLRGR